MFDPSLCTVSCKILTRNLRNIYYKNIKIKDNNNNNNNFPESFFNFSKVRILNDDLFEMLVLQKYETWDQFVTIW